MDNTKVLPSGMTALNTLGLSTQVPMNYTYLTTGSERTVNLSNRKMPAWMKRIIKPMLTA